jgi:integrase
MRGYIKANKNKNGKIISYRIAVSLGRDPVTKKPKHIFETYKRKAEADKRLNELVRRRETGMLFAPSRDSLAAYLKKWLDDQVKPNLSPRTAEGYETIINLHFAPSTIGKKPLTRIKPADIQSYYTDKIKSGLSNRTVLHHAMVLHGAFKNAVKLGLIPYNICDATTPPKAVNKEMLIMNEKEIHLFLELARDTPYYTLFFLALFTGLRRGELLGLKWSDIDLLDMTLSVNRSLYQLANGEIIIRNPKTEKSRRLVSLTPSTCDVLRKELAKQKSTLEELKQKKEEEQKPEDKQNSEKIKKEEYKWSDDRYIFSEWDGKHLLPNTVSHAWQKLAKKSGLKGVRLHDARHTMATLWLKMGIHPKIVQERLGHSSIQITLDTYSHIMPGLQAAAAAKFDEMMLPKPNSDPVAQLEQ